ncbi:hypothetical protein H696_00783 [Fonticula alba]|uniref:GOLD domain-containing protein n=1 Tax=Fonticula alba TaxID=691883 RepID=A0A058ZI92_FONAL|nr:hypothetical protein H696_00783 [Fonticula alba]KCV73242.1 hypothetical protein H696_00783 [Fonticula alba]|eukprot:XP_009492943.1 hypothetical protein H696_00783 [Fonticula alba]
MSSSPLFRLGRLVLLFTMLIASLVSFTSAFTLILGPNEERCFFEELSPGDRMSVTFEVTQGGKLDVDFYLYSPSSNILHQTEKATSETFAFTSSENDSDTPGKNRYRYCFSNRLSSRTRKILSFTVRTDPLSRRNNQNVSRDPQLEAELNELLHGSKAIRESVRYLRVREATHRSTAESSNSRIKYWSIAQLVILLLVVVVQFVFLKRFFEVRRTV